MKYSSAPVCFENRMNLTEKKIKGILFLTCSMDSGGTENHLFNLLPNLSSGYRPVVCCLYNLGEIGEKLNKYQNIKMYHNLIRNRWDVSCLWKLVRILRREDIRILFIVNTSMTILWGIICGKIAGVKAFITRMSATRPVYHFRQRVAVNFIFSAFIDKFIAQAYSHKQYLMSCEGIKAEKIESIYNGVDLERFPVLVGDRSKIKPLGILDDTYVVGIIARLAPEKGHDLLLKAASKIINILKNTHFLIVGDGKEKRKLEALAGELLIEKNVHFFGQRNDVPSIISVFDIAVLCSNPRVETFSNAILEYMAASKPVVATNVGSIAEQVIDGETGFLIPPGDHEMLADRILKLLHNPELAKKMGRAGRKLVEKKFTLQKMIEKYEILFEGLTK